MKKLLVLDNYDSFTYNLVYLLRKLGASFDVFRNDKISLKEAGNYDQILLSPGPGLPSEAGIMPQIVKDYAPTKSILGICLGHQCIGEAFGAKLLNMSILMHGKSSVASICDEKEIIFKGLPKSITIGRYHSWLVDRVNLPESLVITAEDESGQIMGIRHTSYDVRGLQFHPESIMTEYGTEMISNWLQAK